MLHVFTCHRFISHEGKQNRRKTILLQKNPCIVLKNGPLQAEIIIDTRPQQYQPFTNQYISPMQHVQRLVYTANINHFVWHKWQPIANFKFVYPVWQPVHSPWQYIKYILYYIKYIYILFDSLLITRCHKFGNCFQIDNFFPQLQDMEDRYEECLALLREAQEEMKSLKKKQKPGFIRHHYSFNSPFLPDDSLALELETSLRREADKSEDRR